MEMHQLRYFLAVVRTGSFSRAAGECHVSQPSLSQQILKLEEDLGEPLFERTPRGVALTPAAHLLQQSAERILSEVEEARRLVLQARGDVRGKVTVGVLPTIAPYLLPELIGNLAAKFPQAEVIVQEDTTVRLMAQMEQRALDMALLSLPLAAPFLTVEPLFDDELVLALPPGHPLESAGAISLGDLSGEEFILLQDGHCLAQQTEDFCREISGYSPRVVCRSAQLETVLALVRAGLGISLVPRMAERNNAVRGVVLRSLTPAISRRIALAWPKTRRHCLVARAFHDAVRAAAQQWTPLPLPKKIRSAPKARPA